jgi:hypothetical protein
MEMVKDNYIVGVMVGLLMPFLGFFIFYEWKFNAFGLDEFLDLLNRQKSILSAMISISLLINGVVLTIFFQKQKDKIAKGIFFTTCIYAVIAIACKWFL